MLCRAESGSSGAKRGRQARSAKRWATRERLPRAGDRRAFQIRFHHGSTEGTEVHGDNNILSACSVSGALHESRRRGRAVGGPSPQFVIGVARKASTCPVTPSRTTSPRYTSTYIFQHVR